MNHYNKENPNCDTTRMLLLNFRQEVRANRMTTLLFSPSNFNDPEDKVSLPQEADFRLIIVSEDLRWFRHLRPEPVPGGTYSISLTFPFEGTYILFAGYQSKSRPLISDKLKLYVKGNIPRKRNSTIENLVFTSDSLKLEVIREQAFVTGIENKIAVSILKNGIPLQASNIIAHLGAMAHIILIRRNDKSFQHFYSVPDEKYPITGRVLFSQPGIYRMWIQFKTGSRLYTADFTLDVAADIIEERSPFFRRPRLI